MAIEEPAFKLLAEGQHYEVREYEPYLVAEVDVSGKSADSQGFRTLAGYIFGDNESGEKMQMTAPVESRDAEPGETMTYGFVMERKYTLETLPSPNNERIRIRKKPARTVAVHRFSGRWTEANFSRHERVLLDALQADGIKTDGEVELARYNGPFTPWFMRRNELIVPIRWPSATQ
jgi:hypothetical protein